MNAGFEDITDLYEMEKYGEDWEWYFLEYENRVLTADAIVQNCLYRNFL
jgi:hypothetical protein